MAELPRFHITPRTRKNLDEIFMALGERAHTMTVAELAAFSAQFITSDGTIAQVADLDTSIAATYQAISEKGAASGYASLGADTLVPQDQLGTGTQDGTKFLRDDGTWQTPSGGVTDHGALTGLGDDDHPQYTTDAEVVVLIAAAIATHVGLADPHTGYVLESLIAAAGDLFIGTADNTVGILTKGTAGQALVIDPGTLLPVWADAPVPSTYYSVLTNGDPVTPEIVFDALGDVIMVPVA